MKALILRQYKYFFIKYRLYDVHSYINDIQIRKDAMYKFRKKCINSIVASIGAITNINRSKLIEYNKMITTDHRVYIIDLDIKAYFKTETLLLDEVDSSRLDSL